MTQMADQLRVGVDGDLTGYRWGVERKRKLLEREGAR